MDYEGKRDKECLFEKSELEPYPLHFQGVKELCEATNERIKKAVRERNVKVLCSCGWGARSSIKGDDELVALVDKERERRQNSKEYQEAYWEYERRRKAAEKEPAVLETPKNIKKKQGQK